MTEEHGQQESSAGEGATSDQTSEDATGQEETRKRPFKQGLGFLSAFKDAIEADCGDREELVRCIQDTVLHEIGHYFGLDDDALDALGVD